MQGIVATSSAPAAVTRRCPFPASSSLNPAECASRATAACTPAAPALTSNWRSPSLPPPTEGTAEEQPRLLPRDTRVLGALGGRGGRALWRSGCGTRDRAPGRTAGLWDSPFPAIPHFLSVLSVCMCLRARVCIYIYNNIYMFVCWKIVEVGRELVPEPDSLLYFTVPLLNFCRQTPLRRKGEGSQSSPRAKREFL